MVDFIQKQFSLGSFPRGIHLVTSSVLREIPEIARCSVGMLHVFIQHTSASLTINENASPDVRSDLNHYLDRLVPDDYSGFAHTIEGPDDMPAHIKASMMGSSVSIPISNGSPALGTWQGIYLCEHRNAGGRRKLIATLSGVFEDG